MAKYGLEEQAVALEMHNQGSIRATVTLGFPELRSRRGGKGHSCCGLDACVVATLTRHQVRETGARARVMLSSPAGLAARTWCMLAHLP